MKFGDAERAVKECVQQGETITFEGISYRLLQSAKPTCSRGEPKTDIYITAENDRGHIHEFKISYKKPNADFLENKTQAERAQQLFGDQWEKVVQELAEQLKEELHQSTLLYVSKKGRTEEGSITLGWKFEMVNKDHGKLSRKLNLTPEQVREVYAGTNAVGDKRDALINGVPVRDSGIANYMLVGDVPAGSSAQDVFDRLETIEQYCTDHPDIYGVFKAHNYRTKVQKDDGNRPLGVYVHWSNEQGRLQSKLSWKYPLKTKGYTVRAKLLGALKSMGVTSVAEMSEDMLCDVPVHR